ncbi:hypothetical protein M501DRAFT_1000386 [Patellaria atrata CBS 101060]|uniref:Uncharacterized protein n=1 Tax=Patellaria atrata CBS 101060 TaxID=1346257 RepID=A0A9P4SEC3_9PEZI|nr:hypothetical protein M501DRAFT_1000386 [Patellaria atrata CBS 101060]
MPLSTKHLTPQMYFHPFSIVVFWLTCTLHAVTPQLSVLQYNTRIFPPLAVIPYGSECQRTKSDLCSSRYGSSIALGAYVVKC